MAEVQEVVQRPAPFIEALGKTYADELTKTVGGLKDIDVSQLYGPQFVAGESALTEQARDLASGLGAYMGPTAYQQYMSPYQQEVIDTTLAEFDRQAAMRQQGIAQQAIQAGAFGGSREGVQQAEYQRGSDLNRAALQANLLQQGFGQAQNLAQQGFTQTGQQIATLQGLGTAQQAQQQAELEAQKQLSFQQAYQPLQATQTLGSGVMGLISGYPAQTQQISTPSPTALQTGLGTASTLAGIYRLVKGPFG